MSDSNELQTLPLLSNLNLRQGFRLQYEPAQECDVLLFPEGMIKLSASAGEIIKRCNGTRTVEQIVLDLEQQFPGYDLKHDVVEFLTEAWRKGWLAAS